MASAGRPVNAMKRALIVLALFAASGAGLWLYSRGPRDRSIPGAVPGDESPVGRLGTVEVTARLDPIPAGAVFRRELYDYATVLKYRVLHVHRGQVTGDTIHVAHYNPFKPRAQAADRFTKEVGGSVLRFSAGDAHRMALAAPLDDYYMGALVNKYFDERPDPVYWAFWTDPAGR